MVKILAAYDKAVVSLLCTISIFDFRCPYQMISCASLFVPTYSISAKSKGSDPVASVKAALASSQCIVCFM